MTDLSFLLKDPVYFLSCLLTGIILYITIFNLNLDVVDEYKNCDYDFIYKVILSLCTSLVLCAFAGVHGYTNVPVRTLSIYIGVITILLIVFTIRLNIATNKCINSSYNYGLVPCLLLLLIHSALYIKKEIQNNTP